MSMEEHSFGRLGHSIQIERAKYTTWAKYATQAECKGCYEDFTADVQQLWVGTYSKATLQGKEYETDFI